LEYLSELPGHDLNNITPLQGLMVLYLERWTLSNAEVFRAYSAMLPKCIFARKTLVFLAYMIAIPKCIFARKTLVFIAYKIAIPKCIFTQKGYNSPMWNSVQSFINIFPTALKGLYTLKLRYLMLTALWFQNIFSP
jgi:hypothetical protein